MPIRVLVVGPGGAGKSTFARQLAATTGASWIEIDKMFWRAGLTPLAAKEWEARLQLADTVLLLDVPLWRRVWRSLRRSRERMGYWAWLLSWRRRYRPRLLEAVAACPSVELFVCSPYDCRPTAGDRRARILDVSSVAPIHQTRLPAEPMA